jgi:serralysin
LPEVFSGPSSLNLDYQLIENGYNAVVIGGATNDFIKVASSDSLGKAVDGGAGDDVIDGGVGSTFISGGTGSDTIFLDGRAPGVSW